jgi:hypothetical protein
LYFWDYFSSETVRHEDPIDWSELIKAVGSAFALALFLNLGVQGLLIVIFKATVMFTDAAPTVAPRWGWILAENARLFWWAVAVGLPLAALSGLPLSPRWPDTMKKVVQAGLALYAIVLSFGVASLIVGIILSYVARMSGRPGAEALFSILH